MATGFPPAAIPPNPMGAVPGLAGAVPGLAGAVPGLAGVASPQTYFQKFLMGGIEAPKIALTALTLFPTTGIVGLNHQAVGNAMGMLFKIMSYGVGILWGLQFNKVYPGTLGTIISALMFAGPWYIFDCLQILFGPYETEGFVPPVPLEGFPVQKPKPDGSWLFTPTTLSILISTLPAGAYGMTSILKYYMPNVDIENVQKYSGYATMGVTGLGAALSVFSMARAPALAPAGVTAGLTPLRGGGKDTLPPLSHFIKRLKESQAPKARNDSWAFLGILAIVVFGGFTLASARSKVAA